MATGFRYGAKALVTVNAVDLSAYCDDAGLDVGIDTAETTTFSRVLEDVHRGPRRPRSSRSRATSTRP